MPQSEKWGCNLQNGGRSQSATQWSKGDPIPPFKVIKNHLYASCVSIYCSHTRVAKPKMLTAQAK